MARIADEELERIKREVSVQRLAEGRGVKLKRHGKDWIGLCPFHDDRTPSLVITPEKNVWHCLGACQAGGSVIDWVMRAEGVSFRHAAELLRNDHFPLAAASVQEPPAQVVQRSTVKKLQEVVDPDEPDAAALARVTSYYHATLKQSPEAQQYLRSRGLVHAEMIEHFKLGYSNRTLGYRMPDSNRKAGAALRGQLQRIGILRESGHEHFRGSLTVPLLNESGDVVGMYGRKISAACELRPGTPMHLYLPGPHRGIFNAHALSASKEVILCEALIDALTFWCAGFCHVTSAYGIEGFTPELFGALKKHGVQKVLIAYDRDDAGERAAEKLAPELAAAGMSVFRVVFPRHMDANEYAMKVHPAAKSLGTAVRSAQWMAGSRAVAVPREASAAAEPEAREQEAEPSSSLVASSELPAPSVPVTSMTTQSTPAAPASKPEAARAPAPPAPTATLASGEDEVLLSFGPRQWRVRGLSKNTSLASIKVSMRVLLNSSFFQDQLDLMSARARAVFVRQAAEELGQEERVIKGDLGSVILQLETQLESKLRDKLTPVAQSYAMSEHEERDALALLRDPKLLDHVLADFERCGVVGESTNMLALYLASVSRKLEAPLAVVIQSSSAAGKSSLMDAVLRFVPEEEQVSYSAMTGQSLFYMGATDLQHKVLAIAEQEGAQSAAYALKLLQSAGELTIASTGKDPATGRLVTQEYKVQGPVMVMLTTTSISVDEELLNRCMVLTVDEGREQTRAIQRMQRESRTLEGLQKKTERGQVMQRQQNVQRLLKPLHVINPFAAELSFADHATRTRRDHAKYLGLIDAIALVHQYQRPVKTAQVGGGELRYIEATRQDLELADKLASTVLSRGLDELPPQTRRLLEVLSALVSERAKAEGIERSDVRFTQRELRTWSGWGQTQLKVHMRTLLDLEYVAVHYQGHRQRHVYELLVSAESEPSPFEQRAHGYDGNRSDERPDRSATGRRGKRPVLSSDAAKMRQPVGANGSAVHAPESSLAAVPAAH